MKLKCENPKNCQPALTAFLEEHKAAGRWDPSERYTAAFEHGQIWILAAFSGEIWAVNDAEDTAGSFYWDFEQVS